MGDRKIVIDRELLEVASGKPPLRSADVVPRESADRMAGCVIDAVREGTRGLIVGADGMIADKEPLKTSSQC